MPVFDIILSISMSISILESLEAKGDGPISFPVLRESMSSSAEEVRDEEVIFEEDETEDDDTFLDDTELELTFDEENSDIFLK